MLVAILTGLVAALLVDRLFFSTKDKAARAGLVGLAEELNRRIVFYDFINEAGVYTLDYSKDMSDVCEIAKVETKIFQMEKDLIEKIHAVKEQAKGVDLNLAKGVDALATHLKLELVPYHNPEEKGVKIVKLKKKRK